MKEKVEDVLDKDRLSAGVAIQHLSTAIFCHWRESFNEERYPSMVGTGQIHDLWNMMYADMRALYTLEKMAGVEYRTAGIDDGEKDRLKHSKVEKAGEKTDQEEKA